MLAVGEEHHYCVRCLLLDNNAILHALRGLLNMHILVHFQYMLIVGFLCMYCATICGFFALA